MMTASRIPDFTNKSVAGMSTWFAEMALQDVLFHPEDEPSEIVQRDTRERVSSLEECLTRDEIVREMYALYGDGMCETCYPVFMRAAGQPLVA